MRKLGLALALSGLLAGCATMPPPAPINPASLTVPHRLVLSDASPAIPVDADVTYRAPMVMGFTPIAALVAITANAIVAGAEGIRVASNRSQRDRLTEALGPTRQLAEEFTQAFDAALLQALRQEPAIAVATTDREGTDLGPRTTAEARLFVRSDLVLTEDGRALLARASLAHVPALGTPGENSSRPIVVVSPPVEAPSDEAAMAAWVADDRRLLREQASAMAVRLAAVIRATLSDPETPVLDRLPAVRVRVPPVPVLIGRTQSGESYALRLPRSPRGHLLRINDDGRAMVLTTVRLPRSRHGEGIWTWLDVPAGLVAQ